MANSNLDTFGRQGYTTSTNPLEGTFNFTKLLKEQQEKAKQAGMQIAEQLDDAYKKTMVAYTDALKNANVLQRKEMTARAKDEANLRLQQIQQEYEMRKAQNAQLSAQERQNFEARIQEQLKIQKQQSRDAIMAEASLNRVQAAASGDFSKFTTTKQAESLADRQEKREERARKLQDMEEKRAQLNQQIEASQTQNEKEKYQKQLRVLNRQENVQAGLMSAGESLNKASDKLSNLPALLEKSVDNAINDAMSIVDQYETAVTTRLLGSGKNWDDASTLITSNLGLSGITSTKNVLTNLGNLVQKGIAYNVEQRAFLETIKESIATTFDSFDSSLLRIIKLQSEDSTVARMGMEATLTQLFNNWFGDTSYLSDTASSVRAALFEASSLLGTDSSVSFEYQVQKWLGALSSAGVSSGTVTNIATALGNLGSGNVNALASSGMQNLIVEALANSDSNLSYSKLLAEGLNSSNVNVLMKSMVKYLQQIAVSTENNNITRNAYGNVFGVSVSDLQAIGNVASLVEDIYSQTQSSDELEGVTTNLLSTATTRMSLPKRISNLLSNVSLSVGMKVVNNPLLYSIYKLASISEGITGGIPIPSFNFLGTGLNLNNTVEGLAKLGVAGVAGLLQLVKTYQSGNIGKNVSIESFLGTDTWNGGNLSFNNESGTSEGDVIYNVDGSVENSMDEAADSKEAKKSKSLSRNQKESTDKDSTDIYKLLGDGSKENLLGHTYDSIILIQDYTNKTLQEVYKNETTRMILSEIEGASKSSLQQLEQSNEKYDTQISILSQIGMLHGETNTQLYEIIKQGQDRNKILSEIWIDTNDIDKCINEGTTTASLNNLMLHSIADFMNNQIYTQMQASHQQNFIYYNVLGSAFETSNLKLQELINDLVSLTTGTENERVLSVNIKQVADEVVQKESGVPIQFRDYKEEKVAKISKDMAREFGFSQEDEQATQHTIQEFLTKFLEELIVEGSGTNMNSNLQQVGADVSASTFLQHETHYSSRVV